VRHVPVPVDVGRIDPRFRAEKPGQRFQSRELFCRRPVLLEVADQANADPVCIEIVAPTPDTEVATALALAVGARNLPFPPRPDVDPTIFRLDPIADHEMIAQTVAPAPHVPVVVVHARRRGSVGRRVVNHDYLPAPGFDAAWRNQLSFVNRNRALEVPFAGRRQPRLRRRYDRRTRRVTSLEQGVRQWPTRHPSLFCTAAQRDDHQAHTQRNPLHAPHSVSFAAPAITPGPLAHYISFPPFVHHGPSPAPPRPVRMPIMRISAASGRRRSAGPPLDAALKTGSPRGARHRCSGLLRFATW
jgi:hypothetical protein